MRERRTWQSIKNSRPDTPKRRAAYERARLSHELGDKVRRLRESLGLSKVELARRMGSSQSVIARLELGGAEPRFETLDRACAALGADLIVEMRPHLVDPVPV